MAGLPAGRLELHQERLGPQAGVLPRYASVVRSVLTLSANLTKENISVFWTAEKVSPRTTCGGLTGLTCWDGYGSAVFGHAEAVRGPGCTLSIATLTATDLVLLVQVGARVRLPRRGGHPRCELHSRCAR